MVKYENDFKISINKTFFFSKTDEEKANLNGYIPAAKPIIHHHLNGTEGAAEHRTISAISSQELRALPTVKKRINSKFLDSAAIVYPALPFSIF